MVSRGARALLRKKGGKQIAMGINGQIVVALKRNGAYAQDIKATLGSMRFHSI